MSFLIRCRTGDGTVRPLGDLEFASIEEAYLDACAAIPDAATQEMRERRNPFRCAFLISDPDGSVLLEVPFTDLLSPSERESGMVGPSLPGPAAVEAAGPGAVETRAAADSMRERIDRARQLRSETLELRRRAAAHIDRSCKLIRRSRLHMFS